MQLDLDPDKFSEQLSFVWLKSSEGETWQDALNKFLVDFQLAAALEAQIFAFVSSRLAKIGIQRFRRHFEIKRVLSASEISLMEIRWRLDLPSGPLHLRLYCSLIAEKSLLVGICFRSKKLATSNLETRFLQNQDIEAAVNIFKSSSQKNMNLWKTSEK